MLRVLSIALCELARRAPHLLDRLFNKRFKVRRWKRLAGELAERIVVVGYPAALARPAGRRRSSWYADYLDALVQRDVRDLPRIGSLDVLPRLLSVTDLAAPFQLSRPTIRDYVTPLARALLLEELPLWHTNRLSRLVKTPKLHIGDALLAALHAPGEGLDVVVVLAVRSDECARVLHRAVRAEPRSKLGVRGRGVGVQHAFWHRDERLGHRRRRRRIFASGDVQARGARAAALKGAALRDREKELPVLVQALTTLRQDGAGRRRLLRFPFVGRLDGRHALC